MSHPLRFESKKGRICVAWVLNREGTEKLVNGKQHSVWFVPTGMKGLPQNVLLNFRLEFPKSELTIYLPSGISEIFCQMVSTPEHQFLCCFGWAHVVTLELWCLYWTALRASLNNTKCLLNFCHALQFHSIFACEYSILSSLLTIRRLIVPQQRWIKPLN